MIGNRNKPLSGNLGDVIRFFRLKKGLSEKQLASMAGVNPEAISHYENNTWNPSKIILEKLAVALEATVPELTGDKCLLFGDNGLILLIRNMGNNRIKIVATLNDTENLFNTGEGAESPCGAK